MKAPVLIYHKIDEPTSDVKIRGAYTSPRRFAKQIAYLLKAGFSFYHASEMIDYFRNNGTFPKKGLAVSFDDGWKDNYKNAFPILKSFGIKATIFLVPSCIGKSTDQVTADGEGPREHLSKEDIIQMSRNGIEFGSHSMNHKLFNQISREEIESEVAESKKEIEALVQKSCTIFAYPAGFYNDDAISALKQNGYIGAFTTVYGSDEETNLDALNRVEILRRDGRIFQFPRKIKRMALI